MTLQLKTINGVPLSEAIASNWDEIWAFQAKPGDILINTYPKSGTTWIQEIVDLIMNDADEEKCKRAPIYERIPFVDILHLMKPGVEEVNAMPPPRVLKSHLAFQLVPPSFWKEKCKVIYVARNGKDTATSFFYFDQMAHLHPTPESWDEYLERFMKGDVGWGSWYDHVKGFWEQKDKHNILYLFYEDLQQNPLEEIRKVMKFLDKDLPEDMLKKIVQLTSFNKMKENPMANYSTFPSDMLNQTSHKFMRKGKVGDWKNQFTVYQNEAFEADYERQMSDTTLKFHTAILELPGLFSGSGMPGKLQIVEGVSIAEDIASNWQQIQSFQARPGDVLIATYPKAGTTWVQEIVDLILNEGNEEICRRSPTHERMPFVEVLHMMKPGPEEVNAMPSPRVLKTHLPVQLVPPLFWRYKCKVIYVARNPRDTVTSYYYFDHTITFHPAPGSWEEYLHRFMKGDVGWGSWYDHVKGFWEQKDQHNILYLFYEDIKQNPIHEIRKVMRFLDKDLSEEVLEKIVHLSSFDHMKDNPMANFSAFPSDVVDQSQYKFMRKGKVGDWKSHFTVQQNEMFEEKYQQQMHGSAMKFRYDI
ncbi:sulfotransferase family 1C member 4 isoform X1 [Xenopus tropicalis]|uniref:Sulfotransferase n=2 Tax=Xenopus tropicalis TaxID=8364 RepID=A0A8J1ILD2_XENTR|nr:sulfotransferase family 1C member 4 isoform X1 [Xenopus tropicalis]